MEPNTRFLFRDHSEAEMATLSSDGSDVSTSVSADLPDNDHGDGGGGDDDETDLDSMTGKGIKRLCSELLELKSISNEEFYKNIFSNYSTFIRVLEQTDSLANEIMQLNTHISTQKWLVEELGHLIVSRSISEEDMDSIEEFESNETPPFNQLEDHISNVSEILDILLIENRIEEALDLIESEEESFQNIKFEENFSADDLGLFGSAISRSKSSLVIKLTNLAENPRISSPELQKVLSALCRLGEARFATQLMLEHYHARIETGVQRLKSSGTFSIEELSKLVFTTISWAAKSFLGLFGERSSSFGEELVPWAKGETKAFVSRFYEHLSSLPEIPLGTAVRAVVVSVSLCSLLEGWGLVLRPYLVKNIGPSIDEILCTHMEHFKKFVTLFTASDSFVLGKYLVSGILNEGRFYMVVGQELEHCVLTSSGRKIVMLIQTISKDVAPLFALEMEGSVLSGLVNIVEEYILSLEKGLLGNDDSHFAEKSGLSIQQQFSVLANLSTLEKLLPRLVPNVCEPDSRTRTRSINGNTISNWQKKMDSFGLFAKEALSELRAQFFQMYIQTVMLSPETSEFCGNATNDLEPSFTLQKLFLELRKIERLAEDDVFDKEWLLEILRELVEAIFDWISTNTSMWISNETSTLENSFNYKQFALDMQFLMEMANDGGYFSSDPSVLTDIMSSTCASAGISLDSDFIHTGNALHCAKVIENLLEMEKAVTVLPNEVSIRDDATTFSEDSMASDIETTGSEEPGISGINNAETSSLNGYSSPRGGSESDSGDFGDDSNLTVSSL